MTVCCSPVGNSLILLGLATGASRYWELTLRNEDGLAGVEEVNRRKEIRMF